RGGGARARARHQSGPAAGRDLGGARPRPRHHRARSLRRLPRRRDGRRRLRQGGGGAAVPRARRRAGGGVKRLLVIEDGDESLEFARVFLRDFAIEAAHSAQAALAALQTRGADALLIDLRFDRAPSEVLVGDVDDTAARLFAGDRARAVRYLADQQGTLIL